MADNNQPPYITPELSNILATLAQFSGQTAITTPQPNQSTTPPTPPGLGLGAPPPIPAVDLSQLLKSYSGDAAAVAVAAAQLDSRPQSTTQQPLLQPPQDPRLVNRSRTQTPDVNTVPHPTSLPYDYTQQSNQQSHSQNLNLLQQQSSQQYQAHDPRPSLQNRHSGSFQAQPQPPPQAQQGLVIDPASITEWTAGLRCVNKIAVQNREFAGAIKRMISNQQKHEMQWYQGRQELKQTQARRATGASEIHNILGSIGGGTFSAPASAAPQQTSEEKEAELNAFDAKVYKAQLAMHDNMTAELKALGVPFFGTNADRILPDDDNDVIEGDGTRIKGAEGQPKWSPRITKTQRSSLQGRIIAFLEDMYKE